MSDAAPPSETVEICDFEDCDQAPTWLHDGGQAFCSYHAANAALQGLSADDRDALIVNTLGYRPPRPPAWRASPSKQRPGWLVVIGPYDEDFVTGLKAAIPSNARDWNPVLVAWTVNESHADELDAVIRRCS